MQIAIQYASKIRRMQLASKISEWASEKQEAEEMYRQRATSPSQASVDLFATQHDAFDDDLDLSGDGQEAVVNPFLVAKMKKESAFGKGLRKPTQTEANKVNPFAKKPTVIPSSQTGSIRPGLVFDDMSKKDVTKVKSPSVGFGSRPSPKTTPSAQQKSGKQQSLLQLKRKSDTAREKENSDSNTGEAPAAATPLKGFQLWLAENKQTLAQETTDESEIQTIGLTVIFSCIKKIPPNGGSNFIQFKVVQIFKVSFIFFCRNGNRCQRRKRKDTKLLESRMLPAC